MKLTLFYLKKRLGLVPAEENYFSFSYTRQIRYLLRTDWFCANDHPILGDYLVKKIRPIPGNNFNFNYDYYLDIVQNLNVTKFVEFQYEIAGKFVFDSYITWISENKDGRDVKVRRTVNSLIWIWWINKTIKGKIQPQRAFIQIISEQIVFSHPRKENYIASLYPKVFKISFNINKIEKELWNLPCFSLANLEGGSMIIYNPYKEEIIIIHDKRELLVWKEKVLEKGPKKGEVVKYRDYTRENTLIQFTKITYPQGNRLVWFTTNFMFLSESTDFILVGGVIDWTPLRVVKTQDIYYGEGPVPILCEPFLYGYSNYYCNPDGEITRILDVRVNLSLVLYKELSIISSEFTLTEEHWCWDENTIFLGTPDQEAGSLIPYKAIEVHFAIEQPLALIIYQGVFERYMEDKDSVIDRMNFSPQAFEKFSGLEYIFETLTNIKSQLESINLSRGVVLSDNIFNSDQYPVICEVAEKLITPQQWNELNDYKKISMYKWLSNILLLNYHTITNKCLSIIDSIIAKEDMNLMQELSILDLKSKFKVISNWSFSMLDNSLKQHLVKRNLSIVADIYTGFDTEYQPVDFGQNRLLSLQLSITGGLKLSIPKKEDFKFEGVNTLTTETYIKSEPPFKEIESIKNYLNDQISANREFKFGNHDIILNKISNHFINNNDGIDNITETRKGYSFQFSKRPIENIFVIPAENEDLKISFNSLIRIINTKLNLEADKEELGLKIRSLDFNNISSVLISGFSKETPPWNAKSLVQNKVETIVLTNKDNLELRKEGKDYDFKLFKENVKDIQELLLIKEKEEEKEEKEGEEKGIFKIGAPRQSEEEKVEKELNKIFKKISDKEIKDLKINYNTKNFLCAHYNTADLSIIDNFKEVSDKNIDILKKSFSSLAIPIRALGHKVFIRDTLLLSSAAASTLDAVGKSHGINKISLPDWVNRNDMSSFYRNDPNLFKEYAMRDSLITLIHALFMNDFNFRLGGSTLPNTLGSISGRYLKNKWENDEYRGYQIDHDFPLGDAQTSFTPKGISSLGFTGEVSNMFLGAYRGGRNEAFKYGIDHNTKWYDYDLTSCYSTIMSMCGDLSYDEVENELQQVSTNILPLLGQPDYNMGVYINRDNIKRLNFKESYSALKVKFNLPDTIIYPPIPVQMDKNITIYPLSGETLITGLEYLSACKILNKALADLALGEKQVFEDLKKIYYIKVLSGAYIPFKRDLETKELLYPPFFDVINELQANRRMHPKKSSLERIYKDLGNMLYGKVVCGISNKRNFDARTLAMKSMIGNDIANPIIGSWITGFVRALLAELLNVVSLLGGRICSVTTDGFVTDIPDLENVILEYMKNNCITDSFLEDYRNVRNKLSGNPEALEVKTSVKGLMQWTTRGQLSVDPNEIIPIAAMTGFQRFQFSQDQNINFVKNVLGKGNKLLFLQKRLTGASDFYKEGKHVSMVSSLRKFRTIFDTKRMIIQDGEMFDTRPFLSSAEALKFRHLMNQFKASVYSDKYRNVIIPPSSNIMIETIKYFLRMCSEFYNWKIPTQEKYNLAKIINKSLPVRKGYKASFKDSFILDLVNSIEQNTGTVLNNLGEFEHNKEFVFNLHDNLPVGLKEMFFSKFYNFFNPSNCTRFELLSCPQLPALRDHVYVSNDFTKKLVSLITSAPTKEELKNILQSAQKQL